LSSEEEYEEGIYCGCDSFKDSQRPADPYNPTNSQDEDLDNFSSEPETDDVVETDEELELFFPFFNDDLSLTEKCSFSSVESFEGGGSVNPSCLRKNCPRRLLLFLPRRSSTTALSMLDMK